MYDLLLIFYLHLSYLFIMIKLYLLLITVLVLSTSISVQHQLTTNSSCPNNQVLTANGCGCPNAANVHLNATGHCVHCPPPKAAWMPSVGSCITCPPGFVLDSTNFLCFCPISHPFLAANSTCVACPTHQFLNKTIQQCQKCVGNHFYNIQTSQC